MIAALSTVLRSSQSPADIEETKWMSHEYLPLLAELPPSKLDKVVTLLPH